MDIKKLNKKIEKLGIELWDAYDKKMEELGYRCSVENNNTMGRKTTAIANDKFKLLLEFRYHFFNIEHSNHFITLVAEDRNGNSIIYGESVAFYSLNVDIKDFEENEKETFKKLKETFNTMLNDFIEKYTPYCKENRLDFVFNELEEERKNYFI